MPLLILLLLFLVGVCDSFAMSDFDTREKDAVESEIAQIEALQGILQQRLQSLHAFNKPRHPDRPAEEALSQVLRQNSVRTRLLPVEFFLSAHALYEGLCGLFGRHPNVAAQYEEFLRRLKSSKVKLTATEYLRIARLGNKSGVIREGRVAVTDEYAALTVLIERNKFPYQTEGSHYWLLMSEQLDRGTIAQLLDAKFPSCDYAWWQNFYPDKFKPDPDAEYINCASIPQIPHAQILVANRKHCGGRGTLATTRVELPLLFGEIVMSRDWRTIDAPVVAISSMPETLEWYTKTLLPHIPPKAEKEEAKSGTPPHDTLSSEVERLVNANHDS
ncbi:MAG: hypothetical protein MHM6MM_001914 [Cercozoa sp. M6MM]